MSAIGDYIHLSQQGYLEHGITKDGFPEGISNLVAIRKQVAEEAKARIKSAQKSEIR